MRDNTTHKSIKSQKQSMEEFLAAAGLGAIAVGLAIFALILALAVYVYVSWALMTIAKKTKTTPAWMAWIPVANFFLAARIAKTPWWTALIFIVAGWIPFVGWIISVVIGGYWFWRIAERRKYEGWVGLLIVVPVVNLIILGVLAWNDQ